MMMEWTGPSVLSSRPRRRPVKKSALGCARCKERKIKCDETRPSCSRCNEKGFTCPGVPTGPRIRWSTKYEKYPTASTPDGEDPLRLNSYEIMSHDLTQNPDSCSTAKFWTGWIYKNDQDIHDLQLQNTGYQENEQEPGFGPYIDELCSQTGNDCNREDLHEERVEKSVSSVCQSDSDSLFNMLTPSSFTPTEHNGHSFSEAGFYDGSNKNFNSHMNLAISCTPQNVVQSPLYPGIMDIQSELVGAYFSIVCPIFSTFDSEENLFRSFVSHNWQSSVSMFYAILSMAAAKLARQIPSMKIQGLQYQSLALSNLYIDVSNTSGWTSELLFVVLMLGLSTSWHDLTDLGIAHLKAAQKAIRDGNIQSSCDQSILGFVRNALIYWEMVVSSVNDEVFVTDDRTMDCSNRHSSPTGSDTIARPPKMTRIMPHPWTGVASAPQAIFARLTQYIRQLRPFSSRSMLGHPDIFLASLDDLEEETWQLDLPQLHEIANTGDENTPAVHHLLLAEAYMFVNLYQLYYVFPNHGHRRAKLLRSSRKSEMISESSWAGQQVRSWRPLLDSNQGISSWVSFLGRSAIMRLEQIPVTSGTSCIHSLLLLVASGSLFVTTELEELGLTDDILRTRQFVLDRLSRLSDSMLSEPIYYVKQVVVEMFKRLEVGVDVFWMDMLHSMGLITVIG